MGITAEQIAIVDAWIERVRDASAREIERLSHHHPGYRMVARNEEISYASAFLATEAPNDDDLDAPSALTSRAREGCPEG